MSENQKTVRVLNTANGQVREVDAELMNHPSFQKWNVLVDETVRSYEPGLYTPKTAEEYQRMRFTEPAVDTNDEQDED